MAPSIPSAKITLSCPLFAADFDPRNHGLLLVGGGGGEGRSGVGNKIALLNVSKHQEISELVDIQLSRDEDSVTSLAVAESRDDSMIVLAGINSSQAEQIKGNNQHLRSFRLELPLRTTDKKSSDTAGDKDIKSTTALGKVSLFNSNTGGTNKNGQKPSAKVDTYQRLLRLSPYQNSEDGKRIGAIATGLAPVGEIVLFNLSPQPQAKDVLGRIRLGSGEEAEDIDIIEIGDGKFLVAYTNGTEVCTFEISSLKRSNTAPEVRSVFTLPKSSPKRSKYRALRFLSPTALLLLQNTVDRTGCELSILSLPISGTGTKNGTILRRKRLRKSMKIGLSLDVAHLGEGQNHERQYLVALAGSDQSLEILTVDYIPNKGYGSLQVFSTLNEVHPFSMTKVCFSHHRPPTYPVTASTPPQYVKLASISLGNTVVVHTFPLSPQRTLQGRGTSSPRYALRAPGRSDTLDTIFTTSVALLVVAISCFLLQAFTEIRGLTPAYLGATEWLPGRVRDSIARPYLHDITDTGYGYQVTSTATATASAISIAADSTLPLSMIPDEHLRQLLRARQTSSSIDTVLDSIVTPSPLSRHIIIKHNPEQDSIYAYYHHDPDHDHDSAANIDSDSNPSSSSSSTQQKHKIRKWDDLDPQQREKWRHHLSKSGHMALAEGEQALRGIFFGEIGGVMAAAAHAG